MHFYFRSFWDCIQAPLLTSCPGPLNLEDAGISTDDCTPLQEQELDEGIYSIKQDNPNDSLLGGA